MPSESRIDSSSNSIAAGRTGRLPVAITIAPASTTWRRPSAAVIATVFAVDEASPTPSKTVTRLRASWSRITSVSRWLTPAERVRRSSIVMSSLTR